MRTPKHIAAVAGAITAALALAACGGTTSSNETATATTAAADKQVSIGITQIVTHPSLDAAREGFKDALADAGYDATYDEQNAQGDQSTAASIAGKFASDDLDLILAIATPTAQSVAQAVTDVPVLFTAVTDPVAAGLVDSLDAPGGNLTGTSDANPVAEQLALIPRIAPDAKRVGVVYSSGEVNSEVQVEWAKKAAADLGLEIVEAAVTTSSEVQQAAESLEVDAIYVPTDNNVVSALESVLQVAEGKGIPVIAAEGDSVARGSVATYGISYYELGRQTGEMAVRILEDGADPATMPVETQSELLLYLNKGAAKRMGVTIPEDLLAEAKPENITE